METSMEITSQFIIEIQPTPNPNAQKFILDRIVKKENSSTYRTPMECGENQLALELFSLRGIDQLHFFENSITITKFSYEEWSNLEETISLAINQHLPAHNPNYFEADPEKSRREKLGPELLKIEDILDKTIRPGLQGDGGDIQALSIENNILLVRYQGACGTCPSSTTGTLEAIRSILKEEYHPEIEVYIAPEY